MDQKLASQNQRFFTLREKCPNTELSLVRFSCMRTEHGILRSKSPYSVRIRKIRTRNNSVFGHFSRSVGFPENHSFSAKFWLVIHNSVERIRQPKYCLTIKKLILQYFCNHVKYGANECQQHSKLRETYMYDDTHSLKSFVFKYSKLRNFKA